MFVPSLDVLRRRMLTPVFAGILFLIIPVLELRLILLGVLGTLLCSGLVARTTIGRRTVLYSALSAFALAYLAVPYWNAPGHARIVNIFLLTIMLLAVTLAIVRNLSDLEIGEASDGLPALFLALFVVAIALNYRPLTTSITHYGDGPYHIHVTGWTVSYVTRLWAPVLAFVVLSVLYLRTTKRRYLTLAIAALVSAGLVDVLFFQREHEPIFRYPVLYYYLNGLFSRPLTAFMSDPIAAQEALYRTLSFALMLGMAVFFGYRMRPANLPQAVLFGVALVTTPTVSYYTTLTYLEPLMLLLVLVAIVNFERDIGPFIQGDRLGISILALYFAGFMKETALFYGLAFLVPTTWLVWRSGELSIPRKMRKILEYGCLTLIPPLTFLFFRDDSARPFTPHLENLFRPEYLQVVIASYWEQFPLWFALLPLPLVVLLQRRRFVAVILNLAVILGYTTFFLLDGGYLGYSRFNLHVLPAILGIHVAAAGPWGPAAAQNWIAYGCVPVIIAVNLVLSPVDLITGTRQPGWGDHVVLTSEYDNPYREFYRWLADREQRSRVCIVGRQFGYVDGFYHRKHALAFEAFAAPEGPPPDDFFDTRYDICVKHGNALKPRDEIDIPDEYSMLRVFEKGAVRVEVYGSGE